jgi:ABC-type multidrug transport system fused ATPase/permease subunit
VFAAAGFRLLPIVNRLQSLMLQMLTLLPSARLAQQIELLDQSVSSTKQPENDVLVDFVSVSFSYPQSKNQALKDINLSLKPGLQYAIIGPSGAGKTTLIDLAIGVLKPTSGSILRNSTCSIGYVPQDTHIAKLNLEQNIAL